MKTAEKIKSASTIEMRIVLEITETEARFLRLMTQWGSKPYIEWAEKHLSKREFKPLYDGIDSFFDTVKRELPQHLSKIDEARKILNTKL